METWIFRCRDVAADPIVPGERCARCIGSCQASSDSELRNAVKFHLDVRSRWLKVAGFMRLATGDCAYFEEPNINADLSLCRFQELNWAASM